MMSPARIALKAQLLTTRYPGVCDLCGQVRPLDLHELLLTRGEANSSPALLRLALESWQNVGLLCNPCNIGPAKETANRDKLTGKQILRAGNVWLKDHPSTLEGRPLDLLRIIQGANQLESWLASLPMKDPKPYIRKVTNGANTLMRQLGEPHG